MPRDALLPVHRSLAFAIAVEEQNIQTFRDWIRSFQRFDPFYVGILRQLVEEMEQQKAEILYQASRFATLKDRLQNTAEPEHSLSGNDSRPLSIERAKSVLHEAIVVKEDARRFYRYCTAQERSSSSLARLYKRLTAVQAHHLDILHQALGRLERNLRRSARLDIDADAPLTLGHQRFSATGLAYTTFE